MDSPGVGQSAEESSAAEQPTNTSLASWSPEILVVADGSGILPAIGAMLQRRGFQVILAPDSQTALQEMGHYDVAAVIAEASQERANGLDFLGRVKELRADIKTLVVTQLLNPALPVRAYEMDIDDYLHWPLSGAALSNRLRDLLGAAGRPAIAAVDGPRAEQDDQGTPTALDGPTAGGPQAGGTISQAVARLQRQQIQELPLAMAPELQVLAGSAQSLSQRLCQAWSRFQKLQAISRRQPHRFH
ncbi:MAG: response regulator [Desulfobacca sp.]|uniref:response regulator n=1 Tax=Desulfobacca sp. TaxID=2067990 RepID=UPI004049010A